MKFQRLKKRYLLLLLAVGATAFFWHHEDRFLARAEGLMGLLGGDSRFERAVRNSFGNFEPLPLVSETRRLATGFQPIFKPYASSLYIATAHASVLMDAASGEILHGQNMDEKRPIASLTKLMTAILVMERVPDRSELVTISEEAVYSIGSRIGCPRTGYCDGVRLQVGEQLSVESLLKAMLMNSANDSAIALAQHIGGSQAGFVEMMNMRARELGLENSHFCSPSGLEPDGRESECYSSAFDVAKLTAHALRYPEIWEIMRIEEATIVSADGQYEHRIHNTDELLGRFPGLVGTKTGFTPLAGYSLLAVATDPEARHEVIAVVLNDSYRWQSIQSMFDWSFQSFEWQ